MSADLLELMLELTSNKLPGIKNHGLVCQCSPHFHNSGFFSVAYLGTKLVRGRLLCEPAQVRHISVFEIRISIIYLQQSTDLNARVVGRYWCRYEHVLPGFCLLFNTKIRREHKHPLLVRRRLE